MNEKDFRFRHEEVKDEETKEAHRNDPLASLSLLVKAAAALLEMANRFAEGNLSLFSEVCLSKDLWDCVNYSRLWPESHHDRIDYLLQDVLAHISDAHYMIEGVYAMGPGEENTRYKNAFPKIANEIRFALELVREAIGLMDQYIDDNLGDKNETT